MRKRGGSKQPVKRRRANRARKVSTAAPSVADLQNQVGTLAIGLKEALEQQTATAEVLRLISVVPADPQPVFETIVRRAVALCGSLFANVFRLDGDLIHFVASYNVGPSYIDMLRATYPMRPDYSQVSGRVVIKQSVARLADALADPDYDQRFPRAMGWRRMLGIPIMRDRTVLGVIVVGWAEAGPVAKAQEELLKTFADQAVIAIDNARRLNQLRGRNEEIAGWNRDLEARVKEQVEELGRVGRLKRFLPPKLAEMIVSQGNEKILESHRREIVVVFYDLRGYTAFTETAEPEEVLDFLREYHGALGPLVTRFEGTLDQFSGDGIMVFFNDPVPVPNPAERAVKMAIAMREAVSTLIASWCERSRELGFGAGIAQGYATLGQIGYSERSGYTAIGTVCNVAARLCGEAKDGQILLSKRVNLALNGSVTTEQVGALALKGLTQPVVTYNVPLTAGQPTLRVIGRGNH
jgi:adenylate cyclase